MHKTSAPIISLFFVLFLTFPKAGSVPGYSLDLQNRSYAASLKNPLPINISVEFNCAQVVRARSVELDLTDLTQSPTTRGAVGWYGAVEYFPKIPEIVGERD